MRSVALMRAAKIGYIVISAVMCVFGILLAAQPDFSVSAIGVICGVVLIVFGAAKLTGFFSKDLYRLAFQYDLAFGILVIILGTVMLARPENTMNFICGMLGISILADGLFKIQIAVESKKFGIEAWWLILMLAVVAGALGLLLLLRPAEGAHILAVLLGITMLADGILNMGTVIAAVKIIRHQQPDTTETDCYYRQRKD
ncbi:MAG: DUF308 domain-containing protein [Clostridiales bacterium]|nr:DUF308 domain-containing protein [Clostridiales bacterium]